MEFTQQKITLNNGLRLLLIPQKNADSVTVLVMVRAGSRDEKDKLSGISHFMEHIVFKSTEKYKTSHDLTSAIDSLGGEINAYTGKEYTGFYVKIARQYLAKALEVLAQLVTKPRFIEAAIEKEKLVIIEEINTYEDIPMRKVSDLFEELMFGNNGIGREIIGSKQTVKSIRRDDLISYLRERYISGGMVVGVVGGIEDAAAVRQETEAAFYGLATGKENSWEKIDCGKQRGSRLKIEEKKTGQAHMVLGISSYPRGHKDRYVLAVLSTILGGNMSSRLFMEVREKRGLAYYVRAAAHAYYETGCFSIDAGVETGKVEQAIKVILNELVKISGDGKGKLREKEVINAKQYLKGRLILDWEDNQELAEMCVKRLLLEGKMITPEQLLAEIEKVSLADVRRVSRDIFKHDKLNLALIGPYKQKQDRQRFLKLLNFKQ